MGGVSPPDGLHLGRDLLHGYRRILQLALNLPHLIEERLVIEITSERLLLLPREPINETSNLGKFKIELNRHLDTSSLRSIAKLLR
jgi:hypothetical protein